MLIELYVISLSSNFTINHSVLLQLHVQRRFCLAYVTQQSPSRYTFNIKFDRNSGRKHGRKKKQVQNSWTELRTKEAE